MKNLQLRKKTKQQKLWASKYLIKIGMILFLVNDSLAGLKPSNSLISKASTLSDTKNIKQQSFVSQAVQRSGPAVVTLETQRTVVSRNNSGIPQGIFIDPYFDHFFGLRRFSKPPRRRVERNQGSGVIFSPEGFILTNAHVVEKTDSLLVGLSNGQRVPGQVVGMDQLTDLAVIRLTGTGPWPSATLGNSDEIKVGDWAIAVGNPYGLENTVTLGIISNLNRNVSQLGISDKRFSLIQTDAAINPGNSGGPLLNSSGEVIGINTLVRSGPGAGLGFAIPINKARDIAKELINHGRARHPMIGVGLTPINQHSNKKNISGIKGVMVKYVIEGGPGDLAGLKVNDIIISIGDKQTERAEDVINEINNYEDNQPLQFKVKRMGVIYILNVTPKDIGDFKKN